MPAKAGPPSVALDPRRAGARTVAKDLYKKYTKQYAQDFSVGKESMALVYDEKCIGCTQCVDSCPVDAILMVPSILTLRSRSIKSWKAYIVEPACVGCRKCAVACPVNAIAMLGRPTGWKDRNDVHLAQKKKGEDRRKAELLARESAISDGSYFLDRKDALAGVGAAAGAMPAAAVAGPASTSPAAGAVATTAIADPGAAAAAADAEKIWPTYQSSTCTSAAACAEACPTGTISIGDFDGTKLPTFTLETCINCSACADSCPTGAIQMLKGRPPVEHKYVLS